MISLKFEMQKALTGDERTFSVEGVLTYLETVYDFINKILAKSIVKGFEEGNVVTKIELDVTLKVNGKKVDENTIMGEYPKVIGFSTKALADMIIKKAYGTGEK